MKAVPVAIFLTIVFFGVMAAADDGGDITPPVLVAAAADRYQIDTSSRAQAITFTLRMTDDLSGVQAVQIELRHESGYNAQRECQQWLTELHRDVTLQCAVTWPRYSAEGRWLVTWLWLSDGVGNTNSGANNVADCTTYDRGVCTRYEYNDYATNVIRSMEIRVGPSVPGADPPLYLPLLAR